MLGLVRFLERMLAFHCNSHCLPPDLLYTCPSGKQKRLEIDWNPVLGTDDIVYKILVCIRDVTEYRNMEENRKKQEEDEVSCRVNQYTGRSF